MARGNGAPFRKEPFVTVRVGINGFGRIGRNFFRAATARGADIEIVAVNDLGSLKTMAHLLKYDSVLGVLPNDIKAVENGISIDGKVLRVLSERDPKALPWGELKVDLVIESTGFFMLPSSTRIDGYWARFSPAMSDRGLSPSVPM